MVRKTIMMIFMILFIIGLINSVITLFESLKLDGYKQVIETTKAIFMIIISIGGTITGFFGAKGTKETGDIFNGLIK